MALEEATILLGAGVGLAVVLYAYAKGYFGTPKTKESFTAVASADTYTPATESTPATETPTETSMQEPVVEPTPAPAPALYENVQPAPAPVTYSSPSTTSFGAPSITKKPIRSYRRRTAPTSTSVSKVTKSTKSKKK